MKSITSPQGQPAQTHSRNPWKWIPSLYFAEALPYVTVMNISTLMYERLGLSNAEIAFYTSWLYLPWVIKPVWSPLIDLAQSKRWWILCMELLVAIAIAGVAFTIPLPHFLIPHAGLLLADGLQQRHPRHRGRRLLHAGPRPA